jgi:LysM repeat protein
MSTAFASSSPNRRPAGRLTQLPGPAVCAPGGSSIGRLPIGAGSVDPIGVAAPAVVRAASTVGDAGLVFAPLSAAVGAEVARPVVFDGGPTQAPALRPVPPAPPPVCRGPVADPREAGPEDAAWQEVMSPFSLLRPHFPVVAAPDLRRVAGSRAGSFATPSSVVKESAVNPAATLSAPRALRCFTLTNPAFRRALAAAAGMDRKRAVGHHLRKAVGVAMLLAALWLLVGCASGEQVRATQIGDGLPTDGPPAAGPGETVDAGAPAAADFVDPNERFEPTDDDPAVAPLPPPPAEPVDRAEPMPASGADVRTYTVQSGDTLMGIAREQCGHASKWREILALNGLSDRDRILVGQTLKLPGAGGSAAPPAPRAATNTIGATDATPRATGTGNGDLTAAQGMIAASNYAEARRVLSRIVAGGPDAATEKRALELLVTVNRALVSGAHPDRDVAVHTVAKGETLFAIAKRYRVNPAGIAKLNGINPDRILAGQALRILLGTPKLVADASRGTLDLWLGDYILKRYRPTGAITVAPGRHTLTRCLTSAGSVRELDLGLGGPAVHPGGGSGIGLSPRDFAELADIVLSGAPLIVKQGR